MHGLGNDFVILDARRAPIGIGASQARAIADRYAGVGCDQVIVVEPPRSASADAFMRIFNADGGEVGACGNATRCVAAMVMEEKDASKVVVETASGLLEATSAGGAVGIPCTRRPSVSMLFFRVACFHRRRIWGLRRRGPQLDHHNVNGGRRGPGDRLPGIKGRRHFCGRAIRTRWSMGTTSCRRPWDGAVHLGHGTVRRSACGSDSLGGPFVSLSGATNGLTGSAFTELNDFARYTNQPHHFIQLAQAQRKSVGNFPS